MRTVLPIILLFALGCGSPAAPETPGTVRVTGTVHFFTIEGGFWAVRSDDGVTYDPMNRLPPDFQHENLRVSMIVKIRTDMAGTHMVGPIVEIIEIEKV